MIRCTCSQEQKFQYFRYSGSLIILWTCLFYCSENHDVTYYELPSIYGHDTFLLDVIAVGAAVKVGRMVLTYMRDFFIPFSLNKQTNKFN